MANFAIMGFGTVGSGVAEVLRMNGASIAEKLGERLTLKYILDVRDLSASPYASLVVKDFALLESDPELDVVVESIGGAKVAYEFTRRALLAGKHVVTSNKELVAAHGRELLEIARDKNVNYLFEAISVRGISGLSLEDVDVARTLGCRIKLLGRALRLEDGRTAAYVAPHLVPESSPLSGVDGVFNAVMIRGNAVGDVMLYGRGAGDLPTASAVMGDVLDALAHREKRRSLGWSRDAVLADLESELPMRWYIRGEGPARITGAMTAREARALAGQAAALLPVLE